MNFDRNNRSNITEIHGAAVSGLKQQEASKLSLESNSGRQIVSNTSIKPSKRQYVDISWLPGASISYDISSNIKDYVIVPLPIITSDIPNRNTQAWPYNELMYFDPVFGKFIYKTFVGKPNHIEHENKDPKQAKGVILDSSFHFIPKYNVGKIVILAAWDRSKDPHLVKQILSKQRNSYSMGCWVNQFVCGVCNTPYGNDFNACKHQMNPMNPLTEVTEEHINYMNCYGCNFFENSSVSSPADVTACSEDLLLLSI